MHARVARDSIDLAKLIDMVRNDSNGAIALFLGTVRNTNDGRPVVGLEYTAYEAMAERELDRIVREASTRFSTEDIAVQHRIGLLALGDVSVAVATAHPHRARAFDACRYIIEALKCRVPIWKREQYADGTTEWIDPTRATTVPVPTPAPAPRVEPAGPIVEALCTSPIPVRSA